MTPAVCGGRKGISCVNWSCVGAVRKPSGRLEAVQLLRVMDDMLDKAGVNLDSTELTGISQVRVLFMQKTPKRSQIFSVTHFSSSGSSAVANKKLTFDSINYLREVMIKSCLYCIGAS